MPEKKVFAILVRLMGIESELQSSPVLSEKFGMRSLFQPDMQGLHLAMFQHSVFLKQYLPKLSAHFVDLDIMPTMYASQWFLTMFAYTAPIELVYRILDLIFAEGSLVVLMRLSISLLKKNEEMLLSLSEFESVVSRLKASSLLEAYDGQLEEVVQDSVKYFKKISYSTLKGLEEKYQSEARKRSLETARKELKATRLSIVELETKVSDLETIIKKLKSTNTNVLDENRDLLNEIEDLKLEKEVLEKEAELLRLRLKECDDDETSSIDGVSTSR